MQTITDIHEGNTNSYVIPATIALLISIPVAIFFPLIGVPLLIFAVTLYSVRTGVEIDAGRRYRKYSAYFGKKFGTWQALAPTTEIWLQLSVESTTMRTIVPSGPNYASGKSTLKSMTYDIILRDELGKTHIFHEFLQYRLAQKAVAALAEVLALEYEDRVAEKLAENRAKRSRR